jgi:cell division protein FtsQ
MKLWLKNTLWVIGVLTVLVLLRFIDSAQDARSMGLPQVNIDLFEDMMFLSEDDILNRLKDKVLIGTDKIYSTLDLETIESYLSELPEIKTVEVYAYLGSEWRIDITLRRPIARLFNSDGSSCYLDREGTLMPLSSNYTAHVLAVSGNINETDFTKDVNNIINNDSLKTIEILDDLYQLSSYVCSDEFLSAQFTQVYINTYNEFELIPRVGNQRILFGDASNIAGKFKKLELFYTEGISRAGWENYDTINVMYKSQVVCSWK